MFKSVLCLKLKIFTKKSIGLEKLANGRCVFEVQPTGTMVVDRVKEYNPYVFLLIFSLIFMAKQSDDEAKYNIFSVFNDTSHARCLVTTRKLKF